MAVRDSKSMCGWMYVFFRLTVTVVSSALGAALSASMYYTSYTTGTLSSS